MYGSAHWMVRDVVRCIAPMLFLALPAAWSAEPAANSVIVRPKLRPAPPELGRCFPNTAPRAGAQEKVLVVATVSPDGKAGNLQFPPDIEPWQEATARCVMQLLEFDPGTRDGVPVAADISMPLDLRLQAAPKVVPPRLMHSDPSEFSDCYSRAARRAGAEGQILFEVMVEPDGSVSRYELQPGVESWQKVTADCLIPRLRFEPATRDGVPFAAKAVLPLTFSLEGSVPLTLARVVASKDELEAARRNCYPSDSQGSATPHYKVTVNVRGWPSQVMLVESSGDKKLDKAGACIIKKLRFDPAKRGEQPVMSTLLLPMTVQPPSRQ